MNWTLDVDETRVAVSSAKDLRHRLAELHEQLKQRPTIVVLNAPDGACLTMGLGRERIFLNYIAPGGWPAHHVVSDGRQSGTVSYTCRGQLSEMPAQYTASWPDALGAAIKFYESGQMTEKLPWEDD